jgi:alcohol dehydrogenase
MYPPAAVPRMVQMIRSGLIDLDQFELAEFPLDDANAAVAYAAANAGPRQLTVIRPNRR